jgi:dipeptidyl aminopeptidase/acylaminoacyl peptidase
MKVKIVQLILFSFLEITVFAQKPLIDSSVFKEWPRLNNPNISNNGKYVFYTIENKPRGAKTLVVTSTVNHWRVEILNAMSYPTQFTGNSKMIVFLKANDTLGILELGSKMLDFIPNVKLFKLPKRGAGQWIAYKRVKNGNEELVLLNLATREKEIYTGIINFFFSDDGKKLVMCNKSGGADNNRCKVSIINLLNRARKDIWVSDGESLASLHEPSFDSKNNQFAFVLEEKKDELIRYSCWYYKENNDSAINLINDSLRIQDKYYLRPEDIRGFNSVGDRLILELREREKQSSKRKMVKVDIWNYKDFVLQSRQLTQLHKTNSFLGLFRISNQECILLCDKNEIAFDNGGDYILVNNSKCDPSDPSEKDWNQDCLNTVYLVSIRDGQRILLKEKTSFAFNLSPNGKYVIYYDSKESDYYSYNISTKSFKNITQRIPSIWTPFANDFPNSKNVAGAPAGWIENDECVLLYDQNDLWKVDPNGINPPENLTNGYGKKNGIVFHLALENNWLQPIGKNEEIFFSAFDRLYKRNGFYKKKIDDKGDPILLTMEGCIYSIFENATFPVFFPKKANNAPIYLVQKQSTRSFPNYLCTRDFKSFNPLSNLQPQENYNWFTSELVTWQVTKERNAQGVLYKPDNFDCNKRYPIIFLYYEKKSVELNLYHVPRASSGAIDIPWFVSNGYLVFTPDIYYSTGKVGENVVQTIISAAEHLSRMPFVDGKRMGINGFSFGGYETNYLVAHTNIFAAACSASGLSNLISFYGMLMPQDGISRQTFSETGQIRMGHSLWERADLYIRNSPIFQVEDIGTPLLLMNNKDDVAVPYTQGVELFTALRRLKKKVWMLQYDNEGHQLGAEAAEDYHIRISQFFDHYLKGTPAPIWMTEGVNAKMKGIEDGLDLDLSGDQP